MAKKNYLSHKCELKITGRYQEKRLAPDERLRNTRVARSNFDEETAVREAKRCLVNNLCESCDLCRYFCPDLSITRNEDNREIEIDYETCKGCGICAFICPKGAIAMVREE